MVLTVCEIDKPQRVRIGSLLEVFDPACCHHFLLKAWISCPCLAQGSGGVECHKAKMLLVHFFQLIVSKLVMLKNICFLFLQDGLLAQGNQNLILKIFSKIPKISPDGKRLQVSGK